MDSPDRFDTWYATRPLWIRAPVSAATAAAAFGVLSMLNEQLNTLQQPVRSWSAGLRGTLWLALAGAVGGLTYALVWPRFVRHGIAGRLVAGALTAVGAFLPSLLLFMISPTAQVLTPGWFWLSVLGFVLAGAVIIGRPWQRSSL